MCNNAAHSPMTQITRQPDASAEIPSADLKAEDFERPASPFVLSQTIRRLERELRAAESRRDTAERENIVLRNRIRGFERVTEGLAKAYDSLTECVDSLTTRPTKNAQGRAA